MAGKAADAVAFLQDDGAPLRHLLAGGECYTELPFCLRVSDRDSSLYRSLAGHISAEAARDKALDVQGVIDLAIRDAEGWTVVDYKTNVLRDHETPEQFRGRLRDTYTSQLCVYARVLEQTGAPVKRLLLCSIARGGELIELTEE